jgi:hypothetical protein
MNCGENEASFMVHYTPSNTDLHIISIDIDAHDLKNSPFSVKVLPLSYMENILSMDVIQHNLLQFLPMKDLFMLHIQ